MREVPSVSQSPLAAWLTLRGQPSAACRAIARQVEAMGYGTLWIPETPTSNEVFTQAGVLLAATEKLAVASGIANIWARDATATAAAAHTLNDAYPGRFVLGLGTSHATRVADRGQAYSRPLTFMRDYLDSLDSAGPFQPQHERRVPVVLAALRPKMQELARERADGIHSFCAPPEHTADARKRLGGGPLLVPHQAFIIGTPDARTYQKAHAFVASRLTLPNYVNHFRALGFTDNDFEGGGSQKLIDSLVVIADEDTVMRRMRAHLDAGATQVAAHPLIDEPDGGVAQLKLLAQSLRTSA
ncbi:TIGR03620 family F420-dependent LLM class oxidoreductase [Sciscionella sediminilitoris]|uniref:TIGR03620 family F420-dependent LLM class oxidoreductase n=1 Tax=Sciscionella sediminilitoris TaxID=1445613 RepID=UPI00056D32DB|nr:TIGR03620 family F420-dependent LLM class oxidoreductase [Sciscionella sp. SE31]